MIAPRTLGQQTSGLEAVRTAIYHVVVIAFAFLMLYPLLWMVASSFKVGDEIFTSVTSLIPRRF